MKVITQSVHFDADKKLLEHIENKLAHLEHFFARIIQANVILKLERKGKLQDKIAEIKLTLPNQSIVAKGVNKTFEIALNKALEGVKTQLKRHKEKVQGKH